MLILRRKAGERIVIADEITISILDVEGDRVKIGISAPPDLKIVREELLRRDVEAGTNTTAKNIPLQQGKRDQDQGGITHHQCQRTNY